MGQVSCYKREDNVQQDQKTLSVEKINVAERNYSILIGRQWYETTQYTEAHGCRRFKSDTHFVSQEREFWTKQRTELYQGTMNTKH